MIYISLRINMIVSFQNIKCHAQHGQGFLKCPIIITVLLVIKLFYSNETKSQFLNSR